MRDLTDPRWMYTKAALLLLSGLLSCVILLLDCPGWRHATVLAVGVWCFCRAYYFAFYVIERYIDPSQVRRAHVGLELLAEATSGSGG